MMQLLGDFEFNSGVFGVGKDLQNVFEFSNEIG